MTLGPRSQNVGVNSPSYLTSAFRLDSIQPWLPFASFAIFCSKPAGVRAIS